MNNPYFTIIIPTYNRSENLSRSILSVLSQAFKDWELIVVDDGSTDNTKEVFSSFNDARLQYHHQENKGRSAARNHGIEKAKGEFIMFLDDDDYILERHLDVFYNSGLKKDRVYRTGFIEEGVSGSVNSNHYDINEYDQPYIFTLLNMAGIGSQVYPKGIIKKYRFPEQFSYWEDTYFLAEILLDHGLEQIDDRTYVYRVSFDNRTEDYNKKPYENIAAIQHFFKKHISRVDNNLNNVLVAEKLLQYSVRAKQAGKSIEAKSLFEKSKEQGLYLRFWRYYFRYFIP